MSGWISCNWSQLPRTAPLNHTVLRNTRRKPQNRTQAWIIKEKNTSLSVSDRLSLSIIYFSMEKGSRHEKWKPQAQTRLVIALTTASTPPPQFGVDFQDGCFPHDRFLFLFRIRSDMHWSPMHGNTLETEELWLRNGFINREAIELDLSVYIGS